MCRVCYSEAPAGPDLEGLDAPPAGLPPEAAPGGVPSPDESFRAAPSLAAGSPAALSAVDEDAPPAALVELAALASFLAQPPPLKWMAGDERALRMAPPHTSHAAGPPSWMPCTTSIWRPHTVHR
jgi:hypothetical protein